MSDVAHLQTDRRPADAPYPFREQHDHVRKLGYEDDLAIEEFLFATQGMGVSACMIDVTM